MLAREKLDVVDIVLPSYLHYEAAKASLAAGCHLLLEKPMCLRLDHCDELIVLAQRKGLHLAIAHEFRLSSLWGRIKELVDEGATGDLRYCLIELWRNPFRQGANGWRYDSNQVGSWVLEEAIHFFDLARWYFEKAGEPVSVFASASHKRDEHPELQDNFSATLHFQNGGYAVISQTLAGYEHHQTAKLTGTRGALWANWSGAMDRTFHPTFSLKYFNSEKIEDMPVTKIPGEVYELEDLLANMTLAVRGAPWRGASGKDGRWSVAMCLKAQESIKTGRLIHF
jgi:myo-inositol 2-dehydrogenase/D-chiro-inositol 1-dehydrogenase